MSVHALALSSRSGPTRRILCAREPKSCPYVVDHKGLPVLAFPSREHWDAWLDEHAFSSSGIWLKFAKKSSGVSSVSKPESIETALAHGWIDGQLDRFDEQHWLVRFTPRGEKSKS